MQKGIATLEVILGTFIIALLLSAAIPNVTRILDSVALDYETKRFYSELRFLQAMNRSGKFSEVGTGRTNFAFDEAPAMTVDTNRHSYQILRGKVPLREVHNMQNVKSVAFNKKLPTNKLTFNTTGQATNISGDALSCTLTLTSQLGKNSSIVFDSVGRIRGGLVVSD